MPASTRPPGEPGTGPDADAEPRDVPAPAHRPPPDGGGRAEAAPRAEGTTRIKSTPQAGTTTWADLRTLLRSADFRRLWFTRLSGQFGDGVFQASLAGSVLFNPDRQADPLAVALGFAALLLPYSLLGPFTGVLLDRHSRRTVLVVANLARAGLVAGIAVLLATGGRAGPFLGLALVAIAVNRFILAGLSAALPHTAPPAALVTANALSPTSGTVAYTLGVGAAAGLHGVVGAGDRGYALITVAAVGCYVVAAGRARGFGVGALGPDAAERAAAGRLGAALASVVRGLVAGLRHLVERRAAGRALLVVGGYRLGFGVTTIALLLLYRNTLTGTALLPAGAAGLGQVVLLTGAGGFLAAVTTPAAVHRWGPRAWVVGLLLVSGVCWPLFGGRFTTAGLAGAVLVAGLAAQGVKIVADTTVQTACDDAYRGRVFALYDMLFNTCLVTGLVLGALALPESGRSLPVLLAVATAHAALATGYAWSSRP